VVENIMSDLRTTVGVEALRASGWAPLTGGRRSAVLVHSASALPDTLEHIVDALARAPNVNLAAILAPEHGFRGDRQAEHGDPKPYIDPATGIWVHSVYRKDTAELAHTLSGLDIVLVDIQDVGTRLYTFVWTLFSLMQAASRMQSPPSFLVADRPNPLGGLAVEGPLLNTSCCASRYGLAAVPHRHGLTVGEAALFFAATLASANTSRPALNVSVARLSHWRRSYLFRQTGLPWLPPSPNLPTADSAIAYAATVFVEATTASEGRGTTTPFQLIGAPFLNASRFASRLENGAPPSPSKPPAPPAPPSPRHWRPAFFIPTWFKWNGSACAGAELVRPSSVGLFRQGVHLLAALRSLAQPPSAFAWDGAWFGQPGTVLIDRYAGTPRLRELFDEGKSPDDIADAFEAEAASFAETRKPYLLYED
jgi:uncharacterized protein YbbC (DUF1343 family)